MNPVLANPNIKINMSLDDIIHFTREEIDSQLQRNQLRGFRKKNRSLINKNFAVSGSHSVPLMGTTAGVDIYVSNQSPLLRGGNKRKILQAISNRALNSDLLQQSKEVIPAEYKVIKTANGLERVLVPAVKQVLPVQKRLLRPRKLRKNVEKAKQDTNSNSLPDKPPPLIAVPILKPTEMEVDKSDDDMIIFDDQGSVKQLEKIDVTSILSDEILQAKKLCLSAVSSMPYRTTLNDRFTMLYESFQF